MFLRLLPINVLFWLVILAQVHPLALWLLCAASLVALLCGLLFFEMEVRRERKQRGRPR
jgi:hypothetical protein